MPTDVAEINKVLLEDILRIYSDAETQMLEKVAKRVKRGVTEEGWNEIKLKDVITLRQEIESLLGQTGALTKGHLNKGLINAYKKGKDGAALDFKKIKPGKLPKTIINELNIPIHLQRLLMESHNMVDRANIEILRNTQDVYRDVMAEATTGLLTGVETRLQASQNALNKFAAKGITGFVDKAGRNWELASYVEMATRTASAHAAVQGHLDRCMELDWDLVIVSSHAATCPLCAPWGGKPLSISGKTPGYSTIAMARDAGLFHPNCKHTVSAYFPFIDEPEGHVHDRGVDDDKYEAIQKQRYNERQIRKWKRMEAAAITPNAQITAKRKISYWQGIQRGHVDKYNLRRKYGREGIRSRVGVAEKAKKDLIIKQLPKQTQQIHYKDLEKNYDAITNFENKFDDIINNLSDKEKDAIMMYTQTGGAQQINDYLRSNGSMPIFDEYKEAIDYIDSAIEKSKIQDNIIVHRSVGYNFLGDELKNELFTMRENFDVKKIIGMEFEDKGFMSTSLNKTFSNSINIDIKVKKGTNGIAIEKLSIASNEHEVLFGRNTKLKIVDASLEKSTGKINLTAELISEQSSTPTLKKTSPKPKISKQEQDIKDLSKYVELYKDLETDWIVGTENNIDIVRKHSEYINKLKSSEIKSIRSYTGGGYYEVNSHLRGIYKTSDNYIKEIDAIRKAIKDAPALPDNTILYRHDEMKAMQYLFDKKTMHIAEEALRGDTGKLEELKNNILRSTFKDKGFLSTSYSRKVFLKKDGIEIKIHAPKGYKNGMFVEEASEYETEREYIIGDSQKFKVIDVTVDTIKDDYDDDYKNVVLHVVPEE